MAVNGLAYALLRMYHRGFYLVLVKFIYNCAGDRFWEYAD